MTAGRIVLLVFGVVILLIAVGLLFGGGGVLWLDSALKDGQGFITTDPVWLETGSYAIVTEPAHIEVGDGWYWGWHLGGNWGDLVTLKVAGTSNDPARGIFMGVAEEDDWQAYLDDVAYDEILLFTDGPWEVDYRHRFGDEVPEAPVPQGFWSVKAHGTGEQTLEWELETGTYSVVLMNEDGTPGVDLSVRVGAKVPLLFPIGVGLLAGGVVGLIVGLMMIFFAVRRA